MSIFSWICIIVGGLDIFQATYNAIMPPRNRAFEAELLLSGILLAIAGGLLLVSS